LVLAGGLEQKSVSQYPVPTVSKIAVNVVLQLDVDAALQQNKLKLLRRI
jgi:hypothetical protein